MYVHSRELESLAPRFVLFPPAFPFSLTHSSNFHGLLSLKHFLTVKGTLMKVSSSCTAPQPLSGILQSESLRKQQCYPAWLVLHEFIVIQPQLLELTFDPSEDNTKPDHQPMRSLRMRNAV